MTKIPLYSARQALFACATLLGVFTALAPGQASAAVVVSNLGNSEAGGAGFGYSDDGMGTISESGHAYAFTTGTTSLGLNSVVFQMANPDGRLSFKLYSDNSNLPGTDLSVTLAGGGTPSAPGQYTYNASTAYELTANTKYWLVTAISPGTNTGFGGSTTSDASETGAGVADGWSIYDGYLYRSTTNGTPGSWSAGTGGETLRFAVDAAAVPEPGRGVLLLLGSLGVVLRRRRK